MSVTCPVCKTDFEAERSTAKYCSPTCRQRAKRGRDEQAEVSDSLVGSVRRRLRKANAEDTVEGQLAIQIARQIVSPGATGIGALSKELRQVIAEAEELAGATTKTTEPETDELDALRERRERKAREAAAGRA